MKTCGGSKCVELTFLYFFFRICSPDCTTRFARKSFYFHHFSKMFSEWRGSLKRISLEEASFSFGKKKKVRCVYQGHILVPSPSSPDRTFNILLKVILRKRSQRKKRHSFSFVWQKKRLFCIGHTLLAHHLIALSTFLLKTILRKAFLWATRQALWPNIVGKKKPILVLQKTIVLSCCMPGPRMDIAHHRVALSSALCSKNMSRGETFSSSEQQASEKNMPHLHLHHGQVAACVRVVVPHTRKEPTHASQTWLAKKNSYLYK